MPFFSTLKAISLLISITPQARAAIEIDAACDDTEDCAAPVAARNLLQHRSSKSEMNMSQEESAALKGTSPCAVMGKDGLTYWKDCSRGPLAGTTNGGTHKYLHGKADWACEVPGYGIAICNHDSAKLHLLKQDGSLKDVNLWPMEVPVGAVHLDGKIYVACFGKGGRSTGLAVVDVNSGRMEANYEFGGDSYVHNVYAFDWEGKKEIFVASLGNPWKHGGIPGDGLVRFDRNSKRFIKDTSAGRVGSRSAIQVTDKVFYSLTQEKPGKQSRLVRFEKQGGRLQVVGQTDLPWRNGGDGGADVVQVPGSTDQVFATDRTNGNGKLYFYQYSGGQFHLKQTKETGNHPRYTTVLPTGDVVVCNMKGPSLSVFKGLGNNPNGWMNPTTVRGGAVNEPMFFMMSELLPGGNGGGSTGGTTGGTTGGSGSGGGILGGGSPVTPNCCSWDGKTCPDKWCNKGTHECGICSGKWISSSSSSGGGGGGGGPTLSNCCSWDGGKTCGTDWWCNKQSSNCEGPCKGKWQR